MVTCRVLLATWSLIVLAEQIRIANPAFVRQMKT